MSIASRTPRYGIARVLSKRGVCSRTQASEWVRAGRVSVDGRAVLDPESPTALDCDSIAVDGAAYAPSVRSDVGAVAGRYGLMVSDAAPVTPGQIAPGNVRVVVSRTRASVPGCPNWGNGQNYQNWHNETMPGFGCAVNGNLAAMVANPNDLVFGREGSGVGDARTGSKAVDLYRTAPTTGAGGLKDISTKKGG